MTRPFLRRVEAEAEYNIHRLRNHASLAMWCGNNEIYEGIRYWGWEEKYSSESISRCRRDTTCCSVSFCRRR